MQALNQVRHDYLRYANCWEDADVLLAGLRVRPGDRLLSIGSAGDNSFSLLTQNPARVTAVDINAVQLSLMRLKAAAFRTLDHPDFLRFLGFAPAAASDRWTLFQRVCRDLPAADAAYWTARRSLVERGIIHGGKFEHYFRLFRERVLPWIHGTTRVRELLAPKPVAEQAAYFDRHWNNRRWRTLFRLFFSRRLMGRLGRDPAFLREVEGSVGKRILTTAETHLRDAACQSNYFLRYILTGGFGTVLPHYARPENFALIRDRLDRLKLYHGLLESACGRGERFDGINLSNIFEYMSPALFGRTAAALRDHTVPGTRLAYWNLLVPRRLTQVWAELRPGNALSARLTRQDKGFFYQRFQIDELC